eukprot:scaffold825_cov249-Pinguiococcus_pyrenoidosus.AAC.39
MPELPRVQRFDGSFESMYADRQGVIPQEHLQLLMYSEMLAVASELDPEAIGTFLRQALNTGH